MLFEENGGSSWIFITIVVKTLPFIVMERHSHWQWSTRDRNWVSPNPISEMTSISGPIKWILETVLTSEKSAKLIEDTAGSWIFEKDSSVTQFTIERTAACATFSYCKDLECVCIYGYDKNPIDGLCHANTLQTVFIILFFIMGWVE